MQRFSLDNGPGNVPEHLPAPDEFILSFATESVACVAKKARVRAGDVLARAQDRPLSVHAPASGTVTDIGPGFIRMTRLSDAEEASSGEDAPRQEPDRECDPRALEGPALAEALGLLGVDAHALTLPAKALAVNALNPEPGMVWVGSVLRHCPDVVRAGLQALRKLSPAEEFHFVTAHEVDGLFARDDALLRGFNVVETRPVYPASMDPLVIRAATGRELPEGVRAVGLHEIFNIGSVMLTGKPLTETVADVAGKTHRVLIGTPAEYILEQCGLKAECGDVVALNGLFRGRALSDPYQGMGKNDMALALVKAGTYIPVSDAPCIGCGRCVNACPARLSPDMISRCAEFGLFEKCRKRYHVEVCMECGLCGFVCVARRPMLQYMRLAKQESASSEVLS